MPIIHIEKHHHHYMIIDKSGLEDWRLSFRARGMLAYLLTKPDNWEVSMRDLARQSQSDSRQALTRTMQELEHYGYARRVLVRDRHGKLHGYQTFIYEKPLDHGAHDLQPNDQSPTAGNTTFGQANFGPPNVGTLEHNKDLNPNKDLKKERTERKENPPPPPLEGGAAGSSFFDSLASRRNHTDYSPAFDAWWEAYPAHRRIHKKACWRHWLSKGLEARSDAVMANTAALKRTRQWQEGKIPNSTTYLNQERYDTPATDGSQSDEMSEELRAQLQELERQFIAEGGRP